MSTHTPGPWYFYEGEQYVGAKDQPHYQGICSMLYVEADEVGLNAEVDANGKLIAAAPDLLAALIRLFDESAGSFPALDQAGIAIYKATAEE